ncbi:hypothetical protein H4R20_002337 [Coemansia guatemalensis]|uniref:Zn(2)-C6 fungal-type domain-containing protein n=1 Tax=Coemansia guatemalensis TaxID=2761395 RepID=A0A9W8I2N8_9FUNG|nr:hypothetical protein H4R20_002337 [Coemansia guatemalensis]
MASASATSSRESSADAHDVPNTTGGRKHRRASTASSTAEGSSGRKNAKSGTPEEGDSPRYLRACDNCRRRKVKCDGVRPACGHCRRVDTPCHYSIKPKSRRMWKCLETPEGADAAGAGAKTAAGEASAKDDNTAKLLARMETMERLLMQRTGVNLPRASTGGDDMGLHGLGAAAMATGTVAGTPGGIVPPLLSTQPAQRMTSGAGLVGEAGYAQTDGNAGANGNSSSRRMSEIRSADSSHNLGMLDSVQSSNERGTNSVMSGGESHTHMPPLAPETVSGLIHTLFSTPNHIIELIHEKTFRRQYEAGTLPPLLLYSALSSAARYSKDPNVRTDPPYGAAAAFLNRAKGLVVDAMEEPSLGNAQGLVIMCMMHFSLGNETLMSFYKAMALNMCILLGYNRLDSVDGPMQTNGTGSNEMLSASSMSMDWVDRETARRLWWTIFSIENYSSVCIGMAPSIQAEYCDVNLPASTVEWMHGKPESEIGSEDSRKRARIAANPLNKLSAYHSQLSLIFSKVAWLVTRTNSGTEEAVAQFSELNTVLQRWYEGLPKELRLSSVNTLLYDGQESIDQYHICVLHMRFYTTIIQLNHAIPEFTEDPAVIEPGQRKCVIAASRISDLLRASFEIPVESRDMNWYMCVFRAAHIHIYRLLSRDADSIARAKQDLAIHRRHLREGGPLWRICYKLLNRLDDMEQMVMLLPAQIPVADLIKIKHLTRKGKSHLVNMQLDSLIKPALIHSEHGDSEDLPLAARVDKASEGETSKSLYPNDAAGANGTFSVTGAPGFGSPASTGSGSSSISQQNPFSSLATAGLSSMQMGGTDIPPPVGQQHTASSIGSGSGNIPFCEAAAALVAPAAGQTLLPQQQQQQQHTLQQSNGKGYASNMSLGNVSEPILQIANELPPINTNIVIDNNMAETLVNYFYMVTNNNQELQTPPMGPSQNHQLSQLSGHSGSAVSLASQQMLVSSSAGIAPTASSSAALASATMPSDQHQSLFGNAFDLAGLQSVVDNNNHHNQHKSFI